MCIQECRGSGLRIRAKALADSAALVRFCSGKLEFKMHENFTTMFSERHIIINVSLQRKRSSEIITIPQCECVCARAMRANYIWRIVFRQTALLHGEGVKLRYQSRSASSLGDSTHPYSRVDYKHIWSSHVRYRQDSSIFLSELSAKFSENLLSLKTTMDIGNSQGV